jgi:hypothetical protein
VNTQIRLNGLSAAAKNMKNERRNTKNSISEKKQG